MLQVAILFLHLKLELLKFMFIVRNSCIVVAMPTETCSKAFPKILFMDQYKNKVYLKLN